jgi:predicted transcriptional regulator
MTPLGASETDDLGRRERQIMTVIYRRGRATAGEVRSELLDPPSYSAVRGMLRLLEDKGYLRHEKDGRRYVYLPTTDRAQVRRSAVRHLVHTFFDNSATAAVAAMIGLYEKRLDDDDLDRLDALIDQVRRRGGTPS